MPYANDTIPDIILDDINIRLIESKARFIQTILYCVISLMAVFILFLVIMFLELKADYHMIEVERDYLVIRNIDGESFNTQLERSYFTKKNIEERLVSDLETLTGKYNRLHDEALTPPYIVLSGREALLVWKNRAGAYLRWVVPMDSYRAQILMIKPMKSTKIKKRNSSGYYRVIDFRPFVTPGPFNGLVDSIKANTNNDKEFAYEIWSLVTQLSVYTPELEETPRWPLETLVEGGGDCEDASILIASMLTASNMFDEVGFVVLDSNNYYDFREPNHVAVYVKKDGDMAYIDGTSIVMNPYEKEIDGYYYPV